MVNVYDTANRLAQEIRQSEEYKNYKQAKEKIELNPDTNIKIREFEKQRYDSQMQIMQTGKSDEEELKKLQELYAELIQDENAKFFLEAEAKFNLLMTDINKIIGESIKDVISG